MNFLRQVLPLSVVLFTLFSACKKSVTPEPELDLATLQLLDFQLAETAYTSISITHPVIVDGVETGGGEIEVVIPKGTTQLQLTPKTTNFSKAGFALSPALGVKQNFLNRTILYTISSTTNPGKTVHYSIRIREEEEVPAGDVAITGFRFEKAKNPGLPADVESARIVPGLGTFGNVFIFVPVGTDFSSLTPTVTHNGTTLVYSQDATSSPTNSVTVYPAAGLAIDFAYPRVFYLVVKQGNEARVYNVIVDVRNPISISQPAVTTAAVKVGSNQLAMATTYQNRGNHPITIVGVSHSQQVPAGLTVVRGVPSVPAFGLLPGAAANLMASVAAQTYPPGTYAVSSTFKPRLVNYPQADDLLESATLRITTTITH